MKHNSISVRFLGKIAYGETLIAMRNFTDARSEQTQDEFWIVEHPPVFTQGQAGQAKHLLKQSDIPVIQSDRGGQITYHGPGQLVIYLLIDLRRRKYGVRALVSAMEQSIIDLLSKYDITAYAQPKAPGVYVQGSKIASLGLRIRRGCCFHGLALNVNMDLTPFDYINPCGYPGLPITQCADLGGPVKVMLAGKQLIEILAKKIGYTSINVIK